MSDQPELPQDADQQGQQTEEGQAAAEVQQAEQTAPQPEPDPAPAAAEPEAAPVVHPELPPDHPLSYLGGEYRVLAGYIAALEAKLAKLGG